MTLFLNIKLSSSGGLIQANKVGPKVLAPMLWIMTARSSAASEALDRAKQIAPVLQGLQRDGFSIRGIAAELIKRKVQTPRGGAWHPQLVKRILQRVVSPTKPCARGPYKSKDRIE
jgi:hypothetical protein